MPDKPRLSVNQLGEYLEANALRRRRIVEDAKKPANYIVTRYKEAKEAIKEYLCEGLDDSIIYESIEKIERFEPKSEFQENDKFASLELLETIMDTDLPELDGITIKKYEGSNPLFEINGVSVSVNPDLVVNTEDQTKLGTLKLRTSKTNFLSNESSQHIATILKYYSETHLFDKAQVDRKLCLSFDVFAKSLVVAPRSFKRRWDRIELACNEIQLHWKDIG